MIIADENIPPEMVAALRGHGVDVVYVREDFRGICDEDVIWLSREMNRIILTEDKDFGEWVFAHRAEGVSVIFLRYHFKQQKEVTDSLIRLIDTEQEKLLGRFTTVSDRKVRSRDI
jgi:predicted nuclease of predicted toxin-antitoxin system